MSPRSRKEYMETIVKRYKKTKFKKEKSKIIDEVCVNLGYHRKHVIRAINKFKFFTKTKLKKRGNPSIYDRPEILEPLKHIWLANEQPCSKLLKVALDLWLPYYPTEFNYLQPDVVNALSNISPATIDRILKPTRLKYTKRGRSTTKPGSLLRNQIPIKTSQWDETRPGFVEADTVAHCGDTVLGIYVNTVDLVDIATGWTEQRAVWGKGEAGVREQIIHIEKSLPFPILGFDSDNGGEFLNYHLYRYFTNRKRCPVEFTRSRAYRKNDNAHIEQKNWTHVRQWLGYNRFDIPKMVQLINNLYTSEWRLYHNFFKPCMKLINKKRVASKIIKCYDKPKTPYQKVMESDLVDPETKQKLKEQFEKLNPFQLRKAMEKKLKKIFDFYHKNKKIAL